MMYEVLMRSEKGQGAASLRLVLDDCVLTVTLPGSAKNRRYVFDYEEEAIEVFNANIDQHLAQDFAFVSPTGAAPASLLDASVVRELRRLSVRESKWFNPFLPEEMVETPAGPRLRPNSMNHFLAFDWYENATLLAGEVGPVEVRNLELGNSGNLTELSRRLEGPFYWVGYFDGGNHVVCFNLEDENPANPEVFWADHDPAPDENPINSFDCRLDVFLSKMKRIKMPRKPKLQRRHF